jgi:RNA polymerase sigma-70 factor (ECF subfamily)
MSTDRGLSTEELVRRALHGETEAFGALVDLYRHQVYGVCWQALHHREEAEDAAQETFLQAFSRLDTLHEPAKFAAWLHQIAVNVCRMRQRQVEPPAVPLDEAVALPAPESDAALRIVIKEALNSLPEIIRLPFVLRHIDGLSYAEIAEFLDTTRDTVRGRIYMARRQLQEELREMAEEFIHRERLNAGFTKRVKEKLFWHEQPIAVTREVPLDGVILVYLDFYNESRVEFKGTPQGPLRVTGRKVLLGTSPEEAEGRAEQIQIAVQSRDDVFHTGPAEAAAFRGVCWSDAGAQPVYSPIREEWEDLKRELAEFPEGLERLETALEGNCVTVAIYGDRVAPIWLPPAVWRGRLRKLLGAAGWQGPDGPLFCPSGGAEISLSVPPCRMLMVVAAGRQEVHLRDIHGHLMVLNPHSYYGDLRFSAKRIAGDLMAYGVVPTCIEGIGGDLHLQVPGYGGGGEWAQSGKKVRRCFPDEPAAHRRAVIHGVQGKLQVVATNLDLELSHFRKQVRVKDSYGPITARLANFDPEARLIFETITGDVTLNFSRKLPKGWQVAVESEGGALDCSVLASPVTAISDAHSIYVGTLPRHAREKANLQAITGIGNIRLQRSGQPSPKKRRAPSAPEGAAAGWE